MERNLGFVVGTPGESWLRGRQKKATQPWKRGHVVATSSLPDVKFGHYAGLTDAGLVSTEVLDGLESKRKLVEVQVPLPLGVVLAELSGGVYVAAVRPGGNVDNLGGKVRVGDRIVGTSATFGRKTWPSLSLERVLSALKTRYGGEVTLILERSGLSEEIYGADDEETVQLGESAEGLRLDGDEREAEEQVRNALKSFAELRSAGLPAIQTLKVLLKRSANLLKKYARSKSGSASVDSLYKRLVRGSVPLDNKIYNLVMAAHIEAGNAERAVEIFRDMPAANMECYTTLLKAYSRLNRLDEVENVKKEMEKFGVLLSLNSYNTILSAYGSRGNVEKVESLFAEMISRHHKPDVVSWNIRLNAHSKRKSGKAKIGKVLALLRQMKLQKLEPNKITYTVLLGACVSCGELQKAEQFLSDMLRRGIKPDKFTYNKLIEGYGDRLRYESATKVLTIMEDDKDLEPDEYSYGLTIRACCAAGHAEIAETVLGRMKERGLKPSAQLYVTMLRSYAKEGNSGRAFRMVKEMQAANHTPDFRVMSALMHACVEANDGALALSVYAKMVQLRMKSDVVTYTTLIRAYGKRGDAKMALRAFSAMKKENIEPNLTTYNALIELAMTLKEPSLALQVLQEMVQSEKFSLSRKTFDLLCHSECFEEPGPIAYLAFLMDVVKILQQHELYGNGHLYCEMLTACSIVADGPTAELILEQRNRGLFRLSKKEKPDAVAAERRAAILSRRSSSLPGHGRSRSS